ncbi:MAG: hypothetical protein WC455_16495 [Dehalococcoidia bacterium]
MELLKMKKLFLNEKLVRLRLQMTLTGIEQEQVMAEMAVIDTEIKSKEDKNDGKS